MLPERAQRSPHFQQASTRIGQTLRNLTEITRDLR